MSVSCLWHGVDVWFIQLQTNMPIFLDSNAFDQKIEEFAKISDLWGLWTNNQFNQQVIDLF